MLIELGTNTGGGALYFASLMHLMGTKGRVITIDPRGAWQGLQRGQQWEAQRLWSRPPSRLCEGAGQGSAHQAPPDVSSPPPRLPPQISNNPGWQARAASERTPPAAKQTRTSTGGSV